MERDVTILPYVAWNDMLSCCHGSSIVSLLWVIDMPLRLPHLQVECPGRETLEDPLLCFMEWHASSMAM